MKLKASSLIAIRGISALSEENEGFLRLWMEGKNGHMWYRLTEEKGRPVMTVVSPEEDILLESQAGTLKDELVKEK